MSKHTEMKTSFFALGFAVGWLACLIPTGRDLRKQTTIASFFNSDRIECASRDFPVGTVLKVTRPDVPMNEYPSILVPVTSAGPSLAQYANGRHLDLSKAAFAELADPALGLIQVNVEEVK